MFPPFEFDENPQICEDSNVLDDEQYKQPSCATVVAEK